MLFVSSRKTFEENLFIKAYNLGKYLISNNKQQLLYYSSIISEHHSSVNREWHWDKNDNCKWQRGKGETLDRARAEVVFVWKKELTWNPTWSCESQCCNSTRWKKLKEFTVYICRKKLGKECSIFIFIFSTPVYLLIDRCSHIDR